MAESWHYSGVAARRAERKYAFVAASEFHARALASTRGLDLAPAELAAVQEALGDARLHVGALAEARTAYAAARRLVRDDAVHVADLLRKEALVEQRLDRTQQALRTLTRALHTIADLDPPATAMRARSPRLLPVARFRPSHILPPRRPRRDHRLAPEGRRPMRPFRL